MFRQEAIGLEGGGFGVAGISALASEAPRPPWRGL